MQESNARIFILIYMLAEGGSGLMLEPPREVGEAVVELWL
jgi:hypothetical protein